MIVFYPEVVPNTMFSRTFLTLAALALPAGLFAQSDAYQVRYASNLNIGDSVVNLTNTGAVNGFDPAGNICANVYVFDAREEMASCCSCPVTPNGLNSLSARRDLISNTLTGVVPTSIVIKLTATRPVGGTCDPGAPGGYVPGLRAWGTTVHAAPVGYAVTETPFAMATLSASEASKLTTQCSFIGVVGSSYGICKSCRVGGLAAQKF